MRADICGPSVHPPSYIKDGFVVSNSQNADYGGLPFSQLPEDIQAQVLAYEVSVGLLINLPDADVLDIFSRLNSYAVILNVQEKINANHFGPFKVLADKLGHKYYDYWIDQGIVTPKNVMSEVHDRLTATELKPGFTFAGERIPVIIQQRGIFKRQQMRFLMAIKTVFPKPGGKGYGAQRSASREFG